jgi:hypothetical protein
MYHEARKALGLEEPVWTSDGELLNNDRFTLYGGPTYDSGAKYLEPGDPRFGRTRAFLDHAVVPRGFAYKDVVNPFLLSRWLQAREFPVLRIERDVVEVALAMHARRWLYPACRSTFLDELGLVDGLLRARAALRQVPAVVVHFDQIVRDESVLRQALEQLYPGQAVPALHYLDDAFAGRRDEILRRYQTERYRKLADEVKRLWGVAAEAS